MKLKDYRVKNRIRPVDAQRALGVSYVTLWRWESGVNKPEYIQQLKIQDWSNGEVTPADWMAEKPEQLFYETTGKTVESVFGTGAIMHSAQIDHSKNMLKVNVTMPVKNINVNLSLKL